MKRAVAILLGGMLLSPIVGLAHADDAAMDPQANMSERIDHRVDHMTKNLKLTTDQQTQVKSILQAESDQMKPLRDQMKTIHQQSEDKITALLNDTQKKQYEANKEKMKQKWEARKDQMKDMKSHS